MQPDPLKGENRRTIVASNLNITLHWRIRVLKTGSKKSITKKKKKSRIESCMSWTSRPKFSSFRNFSSTVNYSGSTFCMSFDRFSTNSHQWYGDCYTGEQTHFNGRRPSSTTSDVLSFHFSSPKPLSSKRFKTLDDGNRNGDI